MVSVSPTDNQIMQTADTQIMQTADTREPCFKTCIRKRKIPAEQLFGMFNVNIGKKFFGTDAGSLLKYPLEMKRAKKKMPGYLI